jgi:TRAP-type uncharacterized transport system fused permease subunit
VRELPRPLARLAALVAIAMSLYHVYVVVTGVPEALILRGIHITFAFVLILLLYGPGLLLIGHPSDIALAIPTALAGSILLAAGLMGYLFKAATWWER